MSFPGKCKSCAKEIQFKLEDKIQDMLYCDDKCWQDDFKSHGCGLVHPSHKNAILKFPVMYGGKTNCNDMFKIMSLPRQMRFLEVEFSNGIIISS